MKQNVHPAVIAVAVVCLIAIVGYFFTKATQPQPYPGLDAPQGGVNAMNEQNHPKSAADAAKMHIPGVSQPKAGDGAANGGGQ